MQVVVTLYHALREIWTLSFLRLLLSEYVGTTVFVFASLASTLLWPQPPDLSGGAPVGPHHPLLPVPAGSPDPVHVSLTFGISVALMMACLGTAGAVHLNPAVTLSLLAGLRMSLASALLYMIAQVLGAITASGFIRSVTPPEVRGDLGLNVVTPGVSEFQAVCVEMMVTFQLVLCVFATSDQKAGLSKMAPVIVGSSVTLGHLVAIGFTGCSMNPARSLGPAIIAANFESHWVFWVGPFTGALLATMTYDLLLVPRWNSIGDWLAGVRSALVGDGGLKLNGTSDEEDGRAVKIYMGTSYNMLNWVHSFFGKQVSSYFGHSVAATDINGDGTDDIFIGAPLFMDRRKDKKLHEVGQVYLYLQKENNGFSQKPDQILTGWDLYGRFGSAIAPLGDIDQDGYDDIAVGAPFSGGDGRVYIFNGQSDGVDPQYSQVLESPFRRLPSATGFGFALRGGSDVDSNSYPGSIVCHYISAVTNVQGRIEKVSATFCCLQTTRTSPSISDKTNLQLYTSVTVPIAIYAKEFWKTSASIVKKINTIAACGESSRFVIPIGSRTVLSAEAHIALHPDVINPDVKTCAQPHSSQLVSCFDITVCISLQGKKIPPRIVLNAELQLDRMKQRMMRRTLFVSSRQSQGHFQLTLGRDKPSVCTNFSAYLRDESEFKDKLSPILVSLSYSLDNSSSTDPEAPPAFFQGQTTAHIQGFSMPICSQRKENGSTVVVCELSNPMKHNEQVGVMELHAGLYFSAGNLEQAEGSVVFELQLRSKNSHNPNSEAVQLKVKVSAAAVVTVRGSSSPVEYVLPIVNWQPKPHPATLEDIGPPVEHVYELHNLGPGTVNGKLSLEFPSRSHGNFLLYVFANASEENFRCLTDSPDVDVYKVAKPLTSQNDSSDDKPHLINKREVQETQSLTQGPTVVNCTTTNCMRFICVMTNLEKGRSAVVKVLSRLWVQSFLERPFEDYILQSKAEYRVTSMPYKVQPTVFPSGTAEVNLARSAQGVGFFKRTRPPQDDNEELSPDDTANSVYADMQNHSRGIPPGSLDITSGTEPMEVDLTSSGPSDVTSGCDPMAEDHVLDPYDLTSCLPL
ncbi:ITA2B protein, partial [Polypterus senegalus]